MHICLDIDDTISYAEEFFARLTSTFSDAKITIVTFRTDLAETTNYLDSIPVRYDRIYLSSDPQDGKSEGQSLHEWKADCVNRLQPDVFFEDMPEVVALVDSSILVFMPCDDVIREWIRGKI